VSWSVTGLPTGADLRERVVSDVGGPHLRQWSRSPAETNRAAHCPAALGCNPLRAAPPRGERPGAPPVFARAGGMRPAGAPERVAAASGQGMEQIDEQHICQPGLVVLDVTAADETTARAVMASLEQWWAASGITPVRHEPGAPAAKARVHADIRHPHPDAQT
jgi:hypothetical protein